MCAVGSSKRQHCFHLSPKQGRRSCVLQELADAVHGMVQAVSRHVLTSNSGLPLPQCLPYLASMADSWAAYTSSEEEDSPSSATPDSGKPLVLHCLPINHWKFAAAAVAATAAGQTMWVAPIPCMQSVA